jgi:hypothetical protein
MLQRFEQTEESVTVYADGPDYTDSGYKLTMRQLLSDLSAYQGKIDNYNISSTKKCSKSNLPPVFLRSSSTWVGLVHASLENPKEPLCAIFDNVGWEQEKERFKSNGYEVNKCKGGFHHEVFLVLAGSELTHISQTEVPGSELFDLYYYTIDHPDMFGHPISQLLPRLLTNTTLTQGSCFLYVNFRRRHPYQPPLPFEDKVDNAAYRLVNRPYCLLDDLKYCSDAGRKSVTNEGLVCAEFELFSACVAIEVGTTVKSFDKNIGYRGLGKWKKGLPKEDVRREAGLRDGFVDYCCSEKGRNTMQQAMQHYHPDHVAHMPEVVLRPEDNMKISTVILTVAMRVALMLFIATKEQDEKERNNTMLTERQQRQNIHDAFMLAERKDAEAAELRRRLRAIEGREAAATRGPAMYTTRREPNMSSKGTKREARQQRRKNARNTTTLKEIEHEVHITDEQRGYREDAFNMRQMIAHVEAEARHTRERANADKRLLADMSAAHEAATHVIPPPPTIFDAMGGIKQ